MNTLASIDTNTIEMIKYTKLYFVMAIKINNLTKGLHTFLVYNAPMQLQSFLCSSLLKSGKS